ncbi:hypothetical protein [Ruminococcus sp.]|uniref:hypothetical protein n=1 Tax=Ruminococcus sp. TaxID=41978 RepID=UPI003FD7641B
MVKHIFDRHFLFSVPPEIRTVEGLSAIFAFVRCENRLCSQMSRAPNCATPRFCIEFLGFFGDFQKQQTALKSLKMA